MSTLYYLKLVYFEALPGLDILSLSVHTSHTYMYIPGCWDLNFTLDVFRSAECSLAQAVTSNLDFNICVCIKVVTNSVSQL